jgi:MFS transporter, DHA3 family, macrolide efflux protein
MFKDVNINLSLFLLGRLVSDTGTSLHIMIMPLFIIDAGGSAATVGLFSFVYLLPTLLIFPFSGVIGDRINRKAIMALTDFASAGVLLGLAYMAYSGRMSITLLLAVQVIISLLNGLFDPATRGMLPQLVPQDKLPRANSMVAGIKGLSYLLGPVIGAALYANFGIAIVFLVNGSSFLFSGTSEMLIRYTHIQYQAAEKKPGIVPGMIADLSEGLKFVLGNKVIRRLSFFFLANYFFLLPLFTVVLPLFYKGSLEYSDIQYGYLQMVIMLGMLLGSIFVGLVFGQEKYMMRSLKIGSSLLMVMMMMFSVLMFPTILSVLGSGSILYYVLLAAVLCILSAANMLITVPVQTYIQRETPNEYMSRVLSWVGMISRGGMPFGALVYGIMLDTVEVHWTVLVTTLFMILIAVEFLISLVKGHNRLAQQHTLIKTFQANLGPDA